jgi:hypothetical protein
MRPEPAFAGVTAGNYRRTDWLHDGHVVYR